MLPLNGNEISFPGFNQLTQKNLSIPFRKFIFGLPQSLGASVQQINALLSQDFIRLVVVAIAIPIAWWAMNKWLQNFAYRANISAWVFVVAGLLALIIAIALVSVHAIKARMAKPAKSLRTE